MLSYIVTASVNEVKNLKPLNFAELENLKVLIVDEGNVKLRMKNNEHLEDIPHECFGPRERREWFKSRFGSAYRKYEGLIPERCHAETSFGFLIAYEEKADMLLELDDDVHITQDLVEKHVESLTSEEGVTVNAQGKWYNTLENLVLNGNSMIYPRGHPYNSEARQRDYSWVEGGGECVFNMGLWLQHPDLDALTLIYHGGLNGKCDIRSKACRREKVVVGEGTYFAACSMNSSFKAQVIPAFYQLYMNAQGTDRFDDIWSGLFLKKISDHLGQRVCLGKPLGVHAKRSRDVFKDMQKELSGMIINEKLWRIVDKAELSAKSYADCYLELADHLNRSIKKELEDTMHIKFMEMQVEKMKTWVEVLDKLS